MLTWNFVRRFTSFSTSMGGAFGKPETFNTEDHEDTTHRNMGLDHFFRTEKIDKEIAEQIIKEISVTEEEMKPS